MNNGFQHILNYMVYRVKRETRIQATLLNQFSKNPSMTAHFVIMIISPMLIVCVMLLSTIIESSIKLK